MVASEEDGEEIEEIIEDEAEDKDQTELPSRKTGMLRHSGHSHPRISSSITRSLTRQEEADDKEAQTEEEGTKEGAMEEEQTGD